MILGGGVLWTLLYLVLWVQEPVATIGAGKVKQSSQVVVGHYGRDHIGVCLSFGCGGSSRVKAQKKGNAAFIRCEGCKKPDSVEHLCRPRNAGGSWPVKPGWHVLATSHAQLGPYSSLKKHGSLRMEPEAWDVHDPREGAGPEALDLTRCRSTAADPEEDGSLDSGMVELQFVSFVGAPEGGKSLKLAVEPIIDVAETSYKDMAFRSKRKYFRVFKGEQNYEPGSGGIVTMKTQVNLREISTYDVSSIFETRIQCRQNKCQLADWYGCQAVLCRPLTNAELQAMEAFHIVSEETDQKIQLVKAAEQRRQENLLIERENQRLIEEAELKRTQLEQDALFRAMERYHGLY